MVINGFRKFCTVVAMICVLFAVLTLITSRYDPMLLLVSNIWTVGAIICGAIDEAVSIILEKLHGLDKVKK